LESVKDGHGGDEELPFREEAWARGEVCVRCGELKKLMGRVVY
jgi:hypothetical protein